MATRVLGLTEITESQAGKYITHNTALHQLDAWTSVKSQTVFAPTISPLPSEGDAYIVTSATGDWSAFTVGDLAVYYLDSAGAAAWVATTPATGPLVYVEDEAVYVRWSGTQWRTVGAVASVTNLTVPSPNTYTLVLGDANTVIRVGSACTIEVPPRSSVEWATGTEILIRRSGTDAVTITPGGSPEVTINGSVTLAAQHDEVLLRYVEDDEWDAS